MSDNKKLRSARRTESVKLQKQNVINGKVVLQVTRDASFGVLQGIYLIHLNAPCTVRLRSHTPYGLGLTTTFFPIYGAAYTASM